MAQKDILDIANYMKQLDESKIEDDKACEAACKECEEQQAIDEEQLEDEVIDKESLGFIDDSDVDETEEQVNEKYAPKKDWYKAQVTKQKSKPFAFTVDFCYDSYSSETNVTEEDVANMLNKAIIDVCTEAKLPPSAILASSVDSIAEGSGNWPEVTIVINNYTNAIKFGKVWCATDDVEDVAFLLSPTEIVHETEEAEADIFEEDVSDCLEQEIVEKDPIGAIEVEVYNEDGFGEHFVEEVSKYVPGTTATVVKTLSNGDILAKISGKKEDLEKAFAFYLGKKTYEELSNDDKEDFVSRLVFEDGDTIAEADYREAVAHCLDPIDINASTANLAAKDTCAISLIKEEKAKRLATKFLKCLKENDFSSLSDDDLDKLDQIKDAADGKTSGKSLKDDKVWQIMLKQMGVTQKEWDDMTPEQKKVVWDNTEENQPLPKGYFGDGIHTAVDPKTGKKYRYREEFEVFDPKTGERLKTAFDPNYTSDKSTYQHPAKFRREQRKQTELEDQLNREKAAKEAMLKARGKDTWDMVDFQQMISALDGKQRKQLMNDLIADVEKDNKDNPRKAGDETMFIKALFGKKATLRDVAKSWGKSAPGVMKFADETLAIWKKTMDQVGIKSRAQLFNNEAKFRAFKEQLKKNLAARRKGSIVSGR